MIQRIANIAIACVLVIAAAIWTVNASQNREPPDNTISGGSPAATPSVISEDLHPIDDNHVPLPGVDEAFINLVFDYEELHMSPDSPQKMARLGTIATQQYLDDHQLPADTTSAESDMVVTINRDLEKTLVVIKQNDNDTLRTMTVTPEISTSRIDEAGNQVTVYDSLRTNNSHTSTWLKVGSAWKVDREE